MGSVRAKFVVVSIERHRGSRPLPGEHVNGRWEDCELRTIKMRPVSGTFGENAVFWSASPVGSIELGCANLEAAGHFELGQEFYVDFTPAPLAVAEPDVIVHPSSQAAGGDGLDSSCAGE